jgi:hypothetical protein
MNIQAINSISSYSSVFAATQKTSSSSSTGKASGSGGGQVQSSSGSSSSSDDSTTYDKMDLNKDGTVTAAEKALYLMLHPDEAEEKDSIQSYTSQGKQDEYSGGFSGLINLSA